MEFSRQEYWSGLPFPSPGDLPNPVIKGGSPALQADTLTSEPRRFLQNIYIIILSNRCYRYHDCIADHPRFCGIKWPLCSWILWFQKLDRAHGFSLSLPVSGFQLGDSRLWMELSEESFTHLSGSWCWYWTGSLSSSPHVLIGLFLSSLHYGD